MKTNLVITLAASILFVSPAIAEARGTKTTLVSRGLQGANADANSSNARVSRDGRFVVFASTATNLTTPTGNGAQQIVLWDRATKGTTLVSHDLQGHPCDNSCIDPVISPDGEFVAFASYADDLVSGDLNGKTDVFLWRRATGAITRVSVGHLGQESNGDSGEPALSDDDALVAFSSDAKNLGPSLGNGKKSIYVYNAGTSTRVSLGPLSAFPDADCERPAISTDGRWVAFDSDATNVGDSPGANGSDVYLHDRWTVLTTLVSTGFGGAVANGQSFGPSVSKDGRYVAFTSAANNLVAHDTNEADDAFRFDRTTGKMVRVHVRDRVTGLDGVFGWVSLAENGKVGAATVVFVRPNHQGPPDLVFEAFRVDFAHKKAKLASVTKKGKEATASFPRISADGKWVVFESTAQNIAGGAPFTSDVFLRKL